jgi:hypothetical protein
MHHHHMHRFIDRATCSRGAFLSMLRRAAATRRPWEG